MIEASADLFTFIQEILQENITFHAVSVSAKFFCVQNYALKWKASSKRWCFWEILTLILIRTFAPFQLIFMPGGTKTSYTLKQTCNFQLQVCLSMYALLLPPGMKQLKIVAISCLVLWGFFNGSFEWKCKQTCIKCLKSCWIPIFYWSIRAPSK